MGKRKETEASALVEPGQPGLPKRAARNRSRRAYSDQELDEAQKVDLWIAELMRLANIDSNKQQGAQRYKEQKEKVLGLVPGQWHQSVKELPFKANTPGIHAKAADQIIEAALRGDAAPAPPVAPVAPVAPAPPVAPAAPPLVPTPARRRAAPKRPGQSQNLMYRYLKHTTEVVEAVEATSSPADSPPPGREGSHASLDVDHYAILGIQKDASMDQVHQAYKKRALDSHPDKPGGSNEAFLKVRDAFEVLSNKDKRAQYDGGAEHRRSYAAATVGASKTIDASKNILAALLMKRLDKEILGLLDHGVLSSIEQLLRQIRTLQNTSASEVATQTLKDGSGLRREKNGDWTVSISWKCFRLEAVKIKDLGVATTLHSAMVKAREVASARIQQHKMRSVPRSGVMEEEPPLTEKELHDILEEQPYMILMASDSRRKWDDDVEDLPKGDRWMSPMTPSLETALRFRRQIRFGLGKTQDVAHRKEDKTAQSEVAAQERDAFMNMVEELWRMASLKLAARPKDSACLALEASVASIYMKRAIAWQANSEMKSEQNAKLQQQNQSLKEKLLEKEDDNRSLQEQVERTACAYNQMKRQKETKEKILKADRNAKEKFWAEKKARDIAAVLGS